MSKRINVQSVPLVNNGTTPVLTGYRFDPKPQTYIDPVTGESKTFESFNPVAMNDCITEHAAPEEGAYFQPKSMIFSEGSKLKFRMQNSHCQICPDKLPLGEFTMIKDYDFVLEFCDRPISFNETGIPDNLDYGGKLHPPYPINKFKTQKELLKYIVSRRAFYSPFIQYSIEHAHEFGTELNLRTLMEKKKQLVEEEEKRQKEYQDLMRKIDRELKTVEKDAQKLKEASQQHEAQLESSVSQV